MLGLEDPVGDVPQCPTPVARCRRSEAAYVHVSGARRQVSTFVVGAGGKTGGTPFHWHCLMSLGHDFGFQVMWQGTPQIVHRATDTPDTYCVYSTGRWREVGKREHKPPEPQSASDRYRGKHGSCTTGQRWLSAEMQMRNSGGRYGASVSYVSGSRVETGVNRETQQVISERPCGAG
jgi:hypothetical protein